MSIDDFVRYSKVIHGLTADFVRARFPTTSATLRQIRRERPFDAVEYQRFFNATKDTIGWPV